MKRLIWGCILCFAAMIMPPLVMVILFANSMPVARGMLPGEIEVKLKENVRYAIWNDYICNYNQLRYNCEKDLPADWKFKLAGPDGDSIAINIPEHKEDMAGKKMSSIKEAEIKTVQGGKFVLTVDSSIEPRPFSIRPDIMSTVKAVFPPLIIGSIIIGLGGFVLVMWGGYYLIMTYSRKRRENS